MKDLVQYYQAGNQFIQEGNDETTSNNESDMGQGDLSLRGNLARVRKRSLDEAGDDTAREEAGVAAHEGSGVSDLESNFSLGEFGNDPEIQDKVK